MMSFQIVRLAGAVNSDHRQPMILDRLLDTTRLVTRVALFEIVQEAVDLPDAALEDFRRMAA
jgi:hypothetical protein